MVIKTTTRDILLAKGFFPEVLPPCYDSEDLVRCFKGMISDVRERKFDKRSASYIRYSGTKHNGYRRLYGTVHPIPYFNICSFISNKWKKFEKQFDASKLALGDVQLGESTDERAVIIPGLSELTQKMSSQIQYSPYVLKTDISQFFPSIYTHTIPWVAHGREKAKNDTKHKSKTVTFNALDWFVQQCQNSQTRGVPVGPDAFRIVAEFIGCEMDKQLFDKAGHLIIGGVRHVDDYYIGVRSEVDAAVILSHLRDILQTYELQLNDSKTEILSGLYTTDDLWAQELRQISLWQKQNFSYALDKAHNIAKSIKSQSPIKLMLRRFDLAECYRSDWRGDSWGSIEAMLQRVLWHYEHCTDYVCLLLAKRYAIGETIDSKGWSDTIASLIWRYVPFNHHHEIIWLLWVALVCDLKISDETIEQVSRISNSHVKSLLIAAYQKGKLVKKPPIQLGDKLSTTDENWLHNLIARATGYRKTRFSGDFSNEFEHLADKGVELINFEKHVESVSERRKPAISSSKYGYDAIEEQNEPENGIS